MLIEGSFAAYQVGCDPCEAVGHGVASQELFGKKENKRLKLGFSISERYEMPLILHRCEDNASKNAQDNFLVLSCGLLKVFWMIFERVRFWDRLVTRQQ